MIGDIASGVAAVAALLTVYYARATVSVARETRREASAAHNEEMAREAQLLEATRAAHEQEMAERQRALARELWLQRLLQLGKLQDLLWEAADIGRAEIADAPERIAGQPGTWTRLTGVLLRIEAALVSLELLGGPPLADIRQMVGNCRQIGVHPGRVVSETMSALERTVHLSENDANFSVPEL
jgi:hypothetical protein